MTLGQAVRTTSMHKSRFFQSRYLTSKSFRHFCITRSLQGRSWLSLIATFRIRFTPWFRSMSKTLQRAVMPFSHLSRLSLVSSSSDLAWFGGQVLAPSTGSTAGIASSENPISRSTCDSTSMPSEMSRLQVLCDVNVIG